VNENGNVPSLLFVCIGNMCRSPLAEAFARHHGGNRVRVGSAGLSPSGQVHPVVREILRERGIAEKELRSKGVDTIDFSSWDWVISIAGIRAEAFVPEEWSGKTLSWAIEDPVGRSRHVFEDVADDIEAHVLGLLKELGLVGPEAGITSWAGMDGPGTHEQLEEGADPDSAAGEGEDE
jgi:arsenate reductase